jgi:acyl transferase domain-containing protein
LSGAEGTSDATARATAAAENLGDAVAVVCLDGFFPGGAASPSALWASLAEGEDLIESDFAADAVGLAASGSDDGLTADDTETHRWTGGFVLRSLSKDADSDFSTLLDQVVGRLLSGGDPELTSGHGGQRTGVGGLFLAAADTAAWGPSFEGEPKAALANYLSYRHGLTGPSIAVDTLSSSGLASLHQACESLRRGECDTAVVAAANGLPSEKLQALAGRGLIAQDSANRCYCGGEGYLPAEAVGAVLLKRVTSARADGDSVLALIRSSQLAHTGHTAGFGMPSETRQTRLIQSAMDRAGLDAGEIDHVETAANGVDLADRIELSALSRLFGRRQQPLSVGSVKSQLGHAEAASALTQLIKLVMELHTDTKLPLCDVGAVERQSYVEGTSLRFVEEKATWCRRAVPRRALLNSYGIGGTYGALILEGAEG